GQAGTGEGGVQSSDDVVGRLSMTDEQQAHTSILGTDRRAHLVARLLAGGYWLSNRSQFPRAGGEEQGWTCLASKRSGTSPVSDVFQRPKGKTPWPAPGTPTRGATRTPRGPRAPTSWATTSRRAMEASARSTRAAPTPAAPSSSSTPDSGSSATSASSRQVRSPPSTTTVVSFTSP